MTDQRPVLVTGGCGFVGASLCAALTRAGEHVVALDDLSTGTPANWPEDVRDQIVLVEVDVRNQTDVQGVLRTFEPKTIYHLAAIHFIPACDADPARAVSINVVGTQSLLSACTTVARHKPPVVLASTGAVYAPAEVAHTEDSALVPSDIYGYTKLWMEQAARLHHKRFGGRMGIARLFNVVGAGETNPHLVPEIIQQASQGDVLKLGNLTTKRDYIAVDDVVDGLIALAAAATEEDVITCNLGAGRPVDGEDLVRRLAAVLGQDLRVETDQRKLRKSDRPLLEADTSRARQLLGWSAQRTLEEALHDAVADARRRSPTLELEHV